MSGEKAREVKFLPLSRIRTNPVALRNVELDSEKFLSMIETVKRVGILNAVNVREISNPDPLDPEPLYGLIDGLHRFTCAQQCGLQSIPAQIVTMSDADVLEAQIIANIAVVETKPVQYAQQLLRMIASNPALVAAEVAARLGQSTTWLNNRLGLDHLTEEIQKIVDNGDIVVSNAFALSKLPQEIQCDYVERAMTQPSGEFVAVAQKAKKDYDAAKRAGLDPNRDTFSHLPKLQKLATLKDEISRPTVGPALVAKLGIESPAAAFDLAVKWVMSSDQDSIAAQRAAHEQRLKLAKDKRDAAKAERDRIAQERAMNVQVEIAPGIPIHKTEPETAATTV